jgi:hypothetical protein
MAQEWTRGKHSVPRRPAAVAAAREYPLSSFGCAQKLNEQEAKGHSQEKPV